MSFTVADVIREARDLHPAFTERSTGDPPLTRRLSRAQRTLVEDAVKVYPDPFMTEEERIPLPLAPFEAGWEFPENYFARGGTVTIGGRKQECFRIEARRLTDPPRWPSWAIRGDRLYLAGGESRWDNATVLAVPYVPVPGALTAPSKKFVLPESAFPVMVAEAAELLGIRAPEGAGAVPDRQSAFVNFIHAITSERRATIRTVQARR